MWTEKHTTLPREQCVQLHVVQRVEQVLAPGETYWSVGVGVGFRQGSARLHFLHVVYRQEPCSTHPFPVASLGPCT